MTIEAIPGETEFLPILPGLPLIKTRALTPIATTVITRPLAVTLIVALTGGLVAEGVGVAVSVGLGVGLAVEEGVGVGVGLALAFTTRLVWTTFDCEYDPAALCVAEITAAPIPTITNELPETVATFGSEEANFHAPGELEVGGVMSLGESPKVAVIGANVPRVGMCPNTWINIEALPCDQMLVAL